MSDFATHLTGRKFFTENTLQTLPVFHSALVSYFCKHIRIVHIGIDIDLCIRTEIRAFMIIVEIPRENSANCHSCNCNQRNC